MRGSSSVLREVRRVGGVAGAEVFLGEERVGLAEVGEDLSDRERERVIVGAAVDPPVARDNAVPVQGAVAISLSLLLSVAGLLSAKGPSSTFSTTRRTSTPSCRIETFLSRSVASNPGAAIER